MRELSRPLPKTWWLTKPTYLRFMLRELTSLVVLGYAVVMIWALGSGGDEAAFTTFYEFLESPPSIVLHVLVLVAALFHTTTWIALTPKVLVLWRDDEPVEPKVIVGANAVGFLAISAVVLWLVLG